jgi:hypothetical protein
MQVSLLRRTVDMPCSGRDDRLAEEILKRRFDKYDREFAYLAAS